MTRDAAVFFRQLAAAVASGIPMPQGLALAAGAIRDARIRKAAADAERRLRAGGALAPALAAHPEAFSEVEVALVAVGEEHGLLEENLRRLADRSEAAYHSGRRFVLALAYPAFLLVAALLLPPLFVFVTRGAAAYVAVVAKSAFPFVALLAAAAGTVALLRRGAPDLFDRLLLAVPILGPNLKKLALARFGESLAALYAGGVDVRRSLRLAIRSLANRFLETCCAPVVPAVEKGAGLAEALGTAGIFPPELLGTVAVGERTGELDAALGAFARLTKEEADRAMTALMIAIPVVVYLLVALYIAFVVISAFGSYFRMLGGI